MGKKYIISESQYNLILEQKNSFAVSLYNRIKNKPIVKKIEGLYDSNLSKFVDNVVKSFPTLKNKETVITNELKKGLQEPETFLQNNQKSIENISSGQIQEQVGGFVLGLIGIIILIGILKKSTIGCQEEKNASSNLQDLIGKTINLYNDSSEQMLYGKVKINDIKFMDCSGEGSRSHVIMNYDWRVDCLSNPSRIGNEINVTSLQRIGKTTVKTSSGKFNSSFTNLIQQKVGEFCKKPSADFALNRRPSSNSIV
jgi:hypothetical protein